MNESICDVLGREFLTRCAEISILVEVASHVSIDAGHHCVTSDIEFSAMEQKWSVDVLLNDVRAFVAILKSDLM